MQNGRPVCNLAVATSESWRDRESGERRERTEWHRVVIFSEPLVKLAEQYLRKGSKVYLEGQLQTRKYTDKDNIERYSTEVVLQGFNSAMTFLDSAPGQGGGGGGGGSRGGYDAGGSQDYGGPAPSGPGGGSGSDFDDDIPF